MTAWWKRPIAYLPLAAWAGFGYTITWIKNEEAGFWADLFWLSLFVIWILYQLWSDALARIKDMQRQ